MSKYCIYYFLNETVYGTNDVTRLNNALKNVAQIDSVNRYIKEHRFNHLTCQDICIKSCDVSLHMRHDEDIVELICVILTFNRELVPQELYYLNMYINIFINESIKQRLSQVDKRYNILDNNSKLELVKYEDYL